MVRLLKCYGDCEGKFPKEELEKISGKNYCPSCYAAKKKEDEDRDRLYKIINETFGISFPTGLILRQIKQYKEQRGYSYKNIYFAVHYIRNIKKIDLQLKFGIALVPHYYDEMITYYKQLKERREKMVSFNPSEKVQIVRLSKPVINDDYKKKKLIDMESLLK